MPSMLDIHDAARNGTNVIVHEFMGSYVSGAPRIYSFFEGKEDPSFYINVLRNNVPDTWQLRRWCVGKKDDVYAVYAAIDFGRFDRRAVVFFVDRDLSDLLSETYPEAANIYVTDYYSIENDLVNREMLDRILGELLGLVNVSQTNLDNVLAAFEQSLTEFCHHTAAIMAWSVLCRTKDGLRPTMNDIRMRDVCETSNGCIRVKIAEDVRSIAEYCDGRCHMKTSASTAELERTRNAISSARPCHRHIRGKYMLWFLVEYAEGVYRDWKHHFPLLDRQPKRHVQLGENNAMEILGPRGRIPASLQQFLARTISAYAAEVAASN